MFRERLTEARKQTDSLFEIIQPEALYDRPVAERHRIIFYIGHLEAFDWNLMGDRPVHTQFDKLFAFGIDPVGGGLPNDQPRDWPGLEEVQSYKLKIRSAVDRTAATDQMWKTFRTAAAGMQSHPDFGLAEARVLSRREAHIAGEDELAAHAPDAASDLRDADHRGLGEADERIHQDREAGSPDSSHDVP